MKKFVLILGLTACSPLTPQQHTNNLRLELEAVRIGCYVYQKDMKYPRNETLDRDCPKLLTK